MRLKTLGDFVAHKITDPDWAQRSEFERDCHWSVIGPNLLNSSLLSSPDLSSDLASAGDIKVDSCHDALIHMLRQSLHYDSDIWPKKSSCSIRRLGHQFESCWHTVLEQSDHPFYPNIPIRTINKHTLGELDLLLQEPTRQQHWWHIEFAVKFYLGYQFDDGKCLWIGPNQRDHLIDKLSHMREKQLPLADHPDIDHSLQQQSIKLKSSDIQISLPIMRGCLFQPANHQFGGNPILPADVNPQAWQGFWTPQSHAHKYFSTGYWAVLPKYRWLSPAVLDTAITGNELLSYLATYFKHLTAPLCIVKLKPTSNDRWLEQQRWFVVDNQWTERLVPHTPKE